MRALMTPLLRRVSAFTILLTCCFCPVRAENPSPLTSERANAAAEPGAWIVTENRAANAWQAGFPAMAAAIYERVLAATALPSGARARVELARVGALLDAGEVEQAAAALRDYTGPRDASYFLRAALLATAQRRVAPAKTALSEIKTEALPEGERAWLPFAQAQLAELEGDTTRANTLYEQAKQQAATDEQRTRFVLVQTQLQLRARPPSESELASLRSSMEKYAGQRLGYDTARAYAAGLAALNRTEEAQAVLRRELAGLPSSERNTADQMRLMLGLIAGENSADGRQAFRDLLRNGLRPETQRTALHLLARGAKTAAERTRLRATLTELLNAAEPHPVMENLFLVRAQAELADGQYSAAEEDAQAMLARFPGSSLRPAALGVRLAVAWDLRRYRTAAELAEELRGLLLPGHERAELGVLLAEAYFRAGDYRSAADAYDAALREAPQVVSAGVLIFQRVLADMKAERLAEAAALLDAQAGNFAFDVVSRWQAEWNLSRELQARGRAGEAQARVEKLLGGASTGVPDELRVRLLWLRAKLAFDNGQAEAAARGADELTVALAGATLEPVLREEVAGTAALLKAQALLALGRDDEGAALLEKLRAEHRGTKPAIYSYIAQAAQLAGRGDLARAQKTLTDMVDAHRTSEYAPFALYEAAAYAERQGLDRNLQEAYGLLERLVTGYPTDALVFYARLRQGDLLRKLNDFGAARQFYESLINTQGQHPDGWRAHLALADTLAALGGSNHEAAGAIYERLRDLPTAPVDLRAEAGCKWGYALVKHAQAPAARAAWWAVANDFVLKDETARQLGATGRYWAARALLELGQSLVEAGQLDEAQRAYQLILDHHLGGVEQARARLARLQGRERAPSAEVAP